ncbi:sulfotransferase family protein [Halofilum ochraceum]|uniref:sulfotransferase family protein n=1 Tax=Halofilum ochraceum TaxID=1611323 RepID=UPI0009472BFE|nr:sulfotransferase [Halofilum ochraceum]
MTPNFFIIGAPKCGTTSLAHWLSGHPEVYMSPSKEPHYFNFDVGARYTDTWDAYKALFDDASDRFVAIGEASTHYLWSRTAVPQILQTRPDAKFIVTLRFPPDMAISLHAQECGGLEDEPCFERAWRLQGGRRNGYYLPAFSRTPSVYQYGSRCCVGSQLERLYALVPSERILVLFLEDIAVDAETEWRKILRFLRVSVYKPVDFDVRNSRRRVRSFRVKKILSALGGIKQKLGVNRSFGVLAPLYRLNTEQGAGKRDATTLSPEMRQELLDTFKSEIEKVENQVGRIPRDWREKMHALENSQECDGIGSSVV